SLSPVRAVSRLSPLAFPTRRSSDLKAPWLQDPQVGGSAVEDPSEISWLGVSDIAAGLNDRDVGIFVSAIAIANWHKANRYCPRCGTRTEITRSGWVQ